MNSKVRQNQTQTRRSDIRRSMCCGESVGERGYDSHRTILVKHGRCYLTCSAVAQIAVTVQIITASDGITFQPSSACNV